MNIYLNRITDLVIYDRRKEGMVFDRSVSSDNQFVIVNLYLNYFSRNTNLRLFYLPILLLRSDLLILRH